MERTGAVRSGWGMGSARRRSAVHQASTSVTKPRMVAAPLLPVQGTSNFDAIDDHRGEKFYKQPSVIGLLPSNSTLRQGMNAQATALSEHVPALIEALVGGRRPNYDVLPCYCLAVEIGTLVTDIGGTAKGRSRRIAGARAPLVARAGADHYCPLAAHTDDDVEHMIPLAQRQTISDRKLAQRTPRDLAQIRKMRLIVTDPVATSVRQHQVHSQFAGQRF